VVDAAWQAITSWSRRNKDELQNSVRRLLPQRKNDVPRMDMVHRQDVTVELSTRLLAVQREIESLST
jgi:hypothetical protein